MGLDCVRVLVDQNKPQDEQTYADAVRSYLDGAVERLTSPSYRLLLQVFSASETTSGAHSPGATKRSSVTEPRVASGSAGQRADQ